MESPLPESLQRILWLWAMGRLQRSRASMLRLVQEPAHLVVEREWVGNSRGTIWLR